jgi:hypothetical protein
MFGAELEELEHDFPFDWQYIPPKIQKAIAYLKPFRGYTASDGTLVTTAFIPFSGNLSSELVVIHGINSFLVYTVQYLQDLHFPIIYKCIGVNYAFLLLVRLHFSIFDMIIHAFQA